MTTILYFFWKGFQVATAPVLFTGEVDATPVFDGVKAKPDFDGVKSKPDL